MPRLILCGLLMLVCLLSLSHGEAKAANVLRRGVNGGCTWEIDDEGLLRIFPTNGHSGALYGYSGDQRDHYEWVNSGYKYTKVFIEPGVSIDTSGRLSKGINYLFATRYGGNNTDQLEYADLHNLDVSNVENMQYLFYGQKNLKEVDCTGWNTSSATSMAHMFHASDTSNGTSPTEAIYGLGDFDTSNVTDMSSMFYACGNLTSLDLSSFDTGNVTTMASMFYNCRSLESLTLSSNFKTGNVTTMSSMFCNCSQLTGLDLSSFDTRNVTHMGSMFYNCSQLTGLDLSSFDTRNVTFMSSMFYACRNLTSLDLSNFITSNVTSMNSMFYNCSSLYEIDLRSFDTTNTTNMNYFFGSTGQLRSVGVGTNTFASTDSSRIMKSGQWERYATFDGMGVYPGETASSLYLVTGNTTQYPNGWWKPAWAETPTHGDVKWHYISEEGRQENEWVKGGDGRTWSYTFKVADENQTYYIWETEPLPPGYEGDWVIGNPLPYNKGDTAVITNRREDYETGGLVISKSIAAGHTSDASFVFDIDIIAPGEPLSGIFGDVVLSDGKATVALKGGESVTLSDIPVGSSYTITEETPAGYTVYPAGGEISGDISEATIYTAAFVNTPPPPPAPGRFTLSKEVTGRFGESGTYEFLVALQGLEGLGSYTYLHLAEGVAPTDPAATTVSFTADSSGNAFVDVTLGAKEKAVFSNLPEGTRYTITEIGGSNWTASYTVTSDQTVTKADGSAETGVDLTTGEEIVEKDENATVTFTNEIFKTQSLKLQKWVEGANPDSDRSFDFTVLFANLEPNTFYSASHRFITVNENQEEVEKVEPFGRFRSDADGYLEWNVQLKHRDVVIFEGLPVGATYQIAEAACPYIASYQIDGEGTVVNIVTPSGSNTEADQSLSTGKETVDDGEEITVLFRNREVELTTVTVKKVWEDGDNLDDLRSPSIKVQLYAGKDADGKPVPYGEPVTLTAKQNGTADKNTWSYTWEDLIAFESDGATRIDYTVREEEVIGYDGWNEEPVITGDAANGYIVTITNKLREVELKLAKVDQEENTIGVAGAEFSLYPSNYLKADGTVDTTVQSLGTFTTVADGNGAPEAVSLGIHPAGVYYLVETKAPDNYVKLASPIKLTIPKTGNATMEINGSSTEVTPAETTGIPSVSFTFTVPNPRGEYILPETGGSGTQMFFISGFSFVLLAGAMMLLGRKKRDTE